MKRVNSIFGAMLLALSPALLADGDQGQEEQQNQEQQGEEEQQNQEQQGEEEQQGQEQQGEEEQQGQEQQGEEEQQGQEQQAQCDELIQQSTAMILSVPINSRGEEHAELAELRLYSGEPIQGNEQQSIVDAFEQSEDISQYPQLSESHGLAKTTHVPYGFRSWRYGGWYSPYYYYYNYYPYYYSAGNYFNYYNPYYLNYYSPYRNYWGNRYYYYPRYW